ncbi:hypothetical protein C1645_839866 [Glomus cerebriforme]|uniref:Tc1-like transposase DDE domain-containing protein n=1 Tax=Glomus cerebriforme TaxID=658196 RepID=A0A397SBS6_9GLOM|nr:hypothetical protein C1645_839866 [Glomus cerebriforme]
MLEFLPAYSPDYNPIKQSFYYIKNFLRQNRSWVETLEDPTEALDLGCTSIGKDSSKVIPFVM